MPHLFQGCTTEKSTEGWPMGWTTGNSGIDGNDYAIAAVQMSATDIPEACTDAKTFAELVAGLLNAFYDETDVSSWSEEAVMNIGKPLEETGIPHPANTEIQFPESKPPF